MTEPEQPANQPLTRKQMREIRNTGSTPVITPDAAPPAPAPTPASASVAPAQALPVKAAPAQAAPIQAAPVQSAPVHAAPVHAAPVTSAPQPQAPVAVAPLPRAAAPVIVPPAPVADDSVDLGASPLTRRQARQQERIRTASVPVITPELAAAHAASTAAPTLVAETPPLTHTGSVGLESGMHDLFGLATAPAPVIAPVEKPAADSAPEVEPEQQREAEPTSPWAEILPEEDAADQPDTKERTVSPTFGADLLAGDVEQAELPPSFDQLLSRGTGGVSMPNALILSQTPDAAPIVAPLSATGEVLITGTLNLPEGLGSTGHALGTADGKEVDATLVDGELPAHSSPTPIAASAAISTVKTAGEVIKPPVPEKGGKLMLTLAITAGALALALVGVLVLAFATGVLA